MVFEFVIDCGMEIVKCNMVWCGRRFNIVSNCSCIVEVHIMKDKAMIIAYVTLFIGIGLLAFTFISAYIFLINNPSITGSSDLIDVFGSSLAPLIGASIRIMYLGVMGWIGSGLTTRGVQLVTQLKRLTIPEFRSRTPPIIKPMEPIRAQETRKTDKA
jgi:hypothetical protein